VPSDSDRTNAPQISGSILPNLSDILVAFSILTPVSQRSVAIGAPAFGRAAPLFPVVGAALGTTLAAMAWMISGWLPTPLAALALAVLWEICTYGQLRRAAQITSITAAAVLVGRVVGIWLLDQQSLALCFAPLLGSWAIVVMAVGTRDASSPSRKLAPAVLFNEFALASLLTLAAVFSIADGLGILLGVVAATLTVGLRLLLHRAIGGVSLAWLVHTAMLIELATVWIFVALQRFV